MVRKIKIGEKCRENMLLVQSAFDIYKQDGIIDLHI
jgi:hypothetical protein